MVVVAHPRSGSNSLVEILDRHRRVSIVNEPFNENFASWGANNQLFAEFAGWKELSYQVDDDALATLVGRHDAKVATLRRRNVLQTAVSQLVAERTGLWKTWDAAVASLGPDHPDASRLRGPLRVIAIRGPGPRERHLVLP